MRGEAGSLGGKAPLTWLHESSSKQPRNSPAAWKRSPSKLCRSPVGGLEGMGGDKPRSCSASAIRSSPRARFGARSPFFLAFSASNSIKFHSIEIGDQKTARKQGNAQHSLKADNIFPKELIAFENSEISGAKGKSHQAIYNSSDRRIRSI